MKCITVLIVIFLVYTPFVHAFAANVIVFNSSSLPISDCKCKCSIGKLILPELKKKQYTETILSEGNYKIECITGGDDVDLNIEVKKDDVWIEIKMNALQLNTIRRVFEPPKHLYLDYEKR